MRERIITKRNFKQHIFCNCNAIDRIQKAIKKYVFSGNAAVSNLNVEIR